MALIRKTENKWGVILSYLTFSDYIERAMSSSIYTHLGDGTIAGRIPLCKGVAAFGQTEEECRRELQSGLESWMLLGLKLEHSLPVFQGINLNEEPVYEENHDVQSGIVDD